MTGEDFDNFWNHYHTTPLDVSDIELLPIAHNTSYHTVKKIINTEAFDTIKEDGNFNKKLLFFYYGAPIFHVKSLKPCMLVFSPTDQRVYEAFNWSPIDTGAFQKVRENRTVFKNEDFEEGFSYTDFQKEYLLHTPAQRKKAIALLKSHVKFFFENNENYLNGKVRDIGESDFTTIDNIYKLYKQAGNLYQDLNDDLAKMGFIHFDKRILAIEGHTSLPLRLMNLKLIFCYVPNKKDVIAKISNSFDVDENAICTYRPFTGSNIDFVAEGMEKYKGFLTEHLKLTKWPKKEN